VRQRRAERDIEQISEADGGLGRLLATARALERLDAHLQSTLPARLRGQVRLACIEGKTLVLAASSPAWASRARLLADDMLREANRQLDEPLTSTRVIVVPQQR
jgi:hypothetical protein